MFSACNPEVHTTSVPGEGLERPEPCQPVYSFPGVPKMPIQTTRGKTLRIAQTQGPAGLLPVEGKAMRTITAKAEVPLRRQRTQYSCMSASMCACLNALGHECDEDEVNAVMGARPMKGAAWEQALACAQHYGVRGTLVCPSTVAQLRDWTSAGKPVMIAWNPEGREWSHASVVYDVTDNLPEELPSECALMGSRGDSGPWVWVADTNIPNPEKTSRVVPADVFYSKWFEKWPNYLVRRPALMLDREISPEGRQVMASYKTRQDPYPKAAARYNPDRNRGLSREELQEGWADSRRNVPTSFDFALSKARTKRSELFAPWYRVLNWWESYGTPHQKELAGWTRKLPEEGLPRNPGDLIEYERAYTKVKDIYDHPSGKGREFFEEVQRALDLPTPLTLPPSDAEKLLTLSLKPSGDFGKALDRVAAYESKLPGIQAQVEKELNRQVSLAIAALPEDMQAWVASQGVRVFAGSTSNLGMPAGEIEGKPSDVPDNVHAVVGYTIYGGIELGQLQGYALWERRFSFGVLPFFEKSPKPRLFRMTVVSRSGSEAFLDLTERSGAVYPPGKGTLSYSVTKAQYEKAETLPQTRSVVDEISESFRKSVAVWMAWERKQEDRKKAEVKRKEEEERKRKEEAVRKEMEAQEALRQREISRAKAPPAPKTVVDSALSEKFAILDQLISNGFPQAQAAAKAVKDAYQAGGKPSEDQLKALRNMMYRSRMKAEADQFRVASFGPSPSRVARLFTQRPR